MTVLGTAPAALLLLLTASTSALPDLGETVIVSASALSGSAGCFGVYPTCSCLPLFLSAPLAAVGLLPDLELLAIYEFLSFPVRLCLTTYSLGLGDSVHRVVSRSTHIKWIPNVRIRTTGCLKGRRTLHL